MTTNPGDDWTDEQLDRLTPDQPAVRMVKTFAAAWATGDRAMMNGALTESFETGRQLKFLGAFAEWIVQGLNLRNDPAALANLRLEIAQHIAAENGDTTESELDDE